LFGFGYLEEKRGIDLALRNSACGELITNQLYYFIVAERLAARYKLCTEWGPVLGHFILGG
jgi:hypothetical protein